MALELDILDKETYECWYEKKCKFGKKNGGPCDHISLNHKYGFFLKDGKNIFNWIGDEVPNIPHESMDKFFDYGVWDDEDWKDDASYESNVERSQANFKKLRKMAQENLDYLKEHGIEVKDSNGKDLSIVLERILKIPIEEVYYLDVG